MLPSSGASWELQASAIFMLTLLNRLWVLWLFKQLRIFRKRQILEKSGWEKLFGNDFSVFQNSSIRRFQPNLVKVEMTIVCHQKIKTQWSVWPRWLVLATLNCKMSMLIYLRSSNSLMRLGLGRWREVHIPGDGEETDKTSLQASWKSELPQYPPDPQDASLFSTILSLKSLTVEGEGEIPTNWIICARV